MGQMMIARRVLKDDIRPTLSSRVAPDVRALICHCWDKNPQKRPQTFTAVLQVRRQRCEREDGWKDLQSAEDVGGKCMRREGDDWSS